MVERPMLFISRYPRQEQLREGMAQRIKAIDELFKEQHRVYLDIRLADCFFPVRDRPVADVTHIRINLFLALPWIAYWVWRSKVIYCHSIYNFAKVLPLLWLIRRRIVVDLHGAVPEEIYLTRNNNLLFRIFCFVERSAFRRSDVVISVTDKMKRFYEQRYSFSKAENVVYRIAPLNDPTNAGLENSDFQVDGDEAVIIYCGNTQSWQNVDLMLQVISDYRGESTFIILTGNADEFKKRLHEKGLTGNRVWVGSVDPSQLPQYYKAASYGFILRDENVVNRVAAPTKMMEYLAYGIVPIVKWAEIGDLGRQDYEYLFYDRLPRQLTSRKSAKNREAYLALIAQNDANHFRSVVLARL